MKNLIKNGIVAVSILLNLSSMNALSVNEFAVKVYNDLDSIERGSKITIKDAKNNIVYSEVLKTKFKPINEYTLPNLGRGDYSLEIEHDFEIIVKPFRVSARSVEFFEERAYSIFKPVITSKDKKIIISRLNLEKEPTLVKVYDQYGELLHTEKVSDQLELNRIYDFSELDEDKFSLILKSGKRTFVKHIKF